MYGEGVMTMAPRTAERVQQLDPYAFLAVVGKRVIHPGGRTSTDQLLAWADVRNAYQHDSITHALATIERLGWESGAYDTVIRTDSQLITRSPIVFPSSMGIATGATPLSHPLTYFDAIFFFGAREIDLTPAQRADLLAFVRDDGKGFVAAHSSITSFFSWPEFGDMIGGRFDEHPWDITEARVIVDDRAFPAMQHLPATFTLYDEYYQIKDFSRSKMRILARLDTSSVNMKAPLVHRTDGDFPLAWAKAYGKGRVFYSALGHDPETWDKIMNTNLRGVYYCIRSFAPMMIRARRGHIINISSLAGKNALPNGAAYSASKWGLNGLSYSVAEELRAHNIRVEVICPGSVHTEFSPHSGKDSGKMLQPEDVAHVVEMLVTQAPQSFASEVLLRPTLKP